MSDLVTFLRARLDEDEEDARKAGAASKEWRFDESRPTAAIVADGSPRWESYLGSGVWDCDDPYDDCEDARREARDEAEHIVRWDPARVLAEVAAKRVLLAPHAGYHDCTALGSDCSWITSTDFRTIVLPALLAPYAEHPDVDPAWRV
jgi:hypothetical protein